jgi:hypothetical protein
LLSSGGIGDHNDDDTWMLERTCGGDYAAARRHGEWQLVAGVDDTKPSRMTAPDVVTQQNILFIKQIKLF